MRPNVDNGASLSAVPGERCKIGGPKFARLKMLNPSTRNCAFARSPIRNRFIAANQGTKIRSNERARPLEPRVPAGGSANAVGSNHESGRTEDGVLICAAGAMLAGRFRCPDPTTEPIATATCSHGRTLSKDCRCAPGRCRPVPIRLPTRQAVLEGLCRTATPT